MSRSEDLSHLHVFPSQHTPLLKRFPSIYEDPFSDVMSSFDPQQETLEPETPSIDRDNKLLSFSSPRFEYPLLDFTYRQTTLSMTAQLHGMFFLAESPWATAGDSKIVPNELTCYRRNLFQITGEVTLPRSLRYILNEKGEQLPIVSQELVISSTESTEGNAVKIISVPWKTPANPSAHGSAGDEKMEKEPIPIALDLNAQTDSESEFATFPYSWKRLQFRIATANNGRRKELQQHFVIWLKIIATTATGERINICDIRSGAVIVRGRSPRNFQSRKDMPLTGSGHARQLGRSYSGGAAGATKVDGPTSAPASRDPPSMPVSEVKKKEDYSDALAGFDSWQPKPEPGTTSVDLYRQTSFDAINAYPATTPDMIQRTSAVIVSPAQPVALRLVEDDTPKRSSMTPPTKRLQMPPRPPSFSINTMSSPDESADLLYEYFPLSLSDWSEPVDAVYRPHVVHHIRTKLPGDGDPAALRVKSKRMYVE